MYGAENADALPALSIARTTYVFAPSTMPYVMWRPTPISSPNGSAWPLILNW